MAEQFPQEGDGPGRGFPCDPWCGFLATCWPNAVEGLSPQAATIVDDPQEVADRAAEYLEAAAQAKEWTDRKYTAAAFLNGIVGTFGGFTVARTKDGAGEDVPDTDEMVRMLSSEGQAIPMVFKAGRRGYVKVGRVKK
jgi:hypothetical protein